ncbi:MAG: hypothetical protein LBS82_00935, partial [Spirochaetaceae bacterium]|nr:hypothetical protein [Spirochaetaceae bacterium]
MVQSTATLTPASNGNHEEAHIAGGSDPGGRRPHEPPAAVIKNTLTAGADDDGRRLDRILRKARPALPISALHRLLRKGAVTVNGARARASDRVRSGDLIEFNAHEEGGAPPYARTASRATPPAGASPHAANSGANLQTQCNGTVAGNLHVEVRYPRKGGGLGEQS